MKGFSMAYLVLGLVLFLGVHSVRIVADGWRTQTLARMGEMPWKGSYSLVSAVGLALIVWGYGFLRPQAELLANGNLADVLLFGSFLLWAVLSFRAARQRDRAMNTGYAPGTAAGTGVAVVVGAVAWGGFAFWAHAWLIGVAPLAR